jgi:protein-tyrosine-phosphatase
LLRRLGLRLRLRLLQVNVLFVCVGNSGRSVIAERLFRQAAAGRHESRSAGAAVHGSGAEPAVVEALREVGIDASDHVPRRLEDDDLAWAEVVIAACAGVCDPVEGKRHETWGIADPYGLPVEQVRPIRNEIADRVNELVASLAG